MDSSFCHRNTRKKKLPIKEYFPVFPWLLNMKICSQRVGSVTVNSGVKKYWLEFT